MAEFTKAMEAIQQLAETQRQLAAAQERAEQAEASCAVLRGLALDARYYLVYGSRNFDAIQAVIDRINAALSADHPGAALLADARLGRAVRALPPEQGLHHDQTFWRHYTQHDAPGWEIHDGDTPEQALHLDDARGLDKEDKGDA